MIPLHPRNIHFPVALFITATVFGVAGACLTIIPGLGEEKTMAHNDAIHEIMETHELLGFIISGILLVLLIWMILRKSKMRLPEFASMVIMLVLSGGIIGIDSLEQSNIRESHDSQEHDHSSNEHLNRIMLLGLNHYIKPVRYAGWSDQ